MKNYLNLSVKQIYECATGKDFTEIKKGISKKDKKNLLFILKRVSEEKRIDFITYVMDECYSNPFNYLSDMKCEPMLDENFADFLRMRAFRNLRPIAKVRLDSIFNTPGATQIKALATDMCYPDSETDYFGFPRKVDIG